MAFLSSVLTNLFRSVYGKKGVKLTDPLTFMPDWGQEEAPEPVRQTAEEMKEILYSIAGSMKGSKSGEKRMIQKQALAKKHKK